jgi:nucleoside-diphosphate-sugar epimerase
LADLCASGVSGTTYNVATGRATPIFEILETLMTVAALGSHVDVRRSYVRPADVPRFVADISTIATLGFSPRYALRESLAETLDYYRKVLRSGAVTAIACPHGRRGGALVCDECLEKFARAIGDLLDRKRA